VRTLVLLILSSSLLGSPSLNPFIKVFTDLSSFHHPANQCSRGDTYRKRRRNSEHKMSLEAITGVIQELFGSIAALLGGAPYCSYAIPDCISNRAGCASRLVR
jgi:hypothetical protein